MCDRKWLTLIACVLACRTVLQAAPASTSPTLELDDARQLSALIRQLGDDNFRKRSSAQRELSEFGNEAIPALEQAARSSDAEVRTRAAAVLQAIRAPDRETRITLHLHDVSAQEAVDALIRQGSIEIGTTSRAARSLLARTKLSIDARGVPFWEVLLEICQATDMRPTVNADGAVILEDTGNTWATSCTRVHGAFAVAIASLRQGMNVRYGMRQPLVPPGPDLTLQVYGEPRTHMQSIKQVTITRCEDETGFPIGVGQENVQNFGTNPTAVIFPLRPESAKAISRIEGQAVVLLAGTSKRVDVPSLVAARQVPLMAGAARMELKDCRQTSQDRWAVRVDVLRDEQDEPAMSSAVQRIADSKPRILDAAGHELQLLGLPPHTNLPNGAGVEIEFHYYAGDRGQGAQGAPSSLSWDVPTSTREVTVPFNFVDIPLP